MMKIYGTVYPDGLNVKFNNCNLVKKLKSENIDESIYEKINHDYRNEFCNVNSRRHFNMNHLNKENINNCKRTMNAIITYDSVRRYM